jgi:hypothetical protein
VYYLNALYALSRALAETRAASGPDLSSRMFPSPGSSLEVGSALRRDVAALSLYKFSPRAGIITLARIPIYR